MVKNNINEAKKNRAYKHGHDIGKSKKRNRNKCKYGHFLLREKWFQGFEKGLKEKSNVRC